MRKLFEITLSPIKDYTLFDLYRKLMNMTRLVFLFLLRNSIKIGLLTLGICFLFNTDFNVQFQFNNKDIIPNSAEQFSFGNTLGNFLDFDNKHVSKMEVHQKGDVPASNKPKTDWGNTYSNMTYGTQKKDTRLKREKQLAYVNRFKDVARSEMLKYGIPASITLAQGLIESNAGESRLSRENNNHFGMKCFSKSCGKGHCSNFTDDSHKDFFRKYNTCWESFRAHSVLLTGKRYRGLRKHGTNYKEWARGLKKAGYATDKRYAEKLIHIIEELDLHTYDK